MKRWLLLRLSWVTGLPDWMSLPTGRVQPWQEGGRCCASTLQVGGSGRAWQNAYLLEESSEQLVGNTKKNTNAWVMFSTCRMPSTSALCSAGRRRYTYLACLQPSGQKHRHTNTHCTDEPQEPHGVYSGWQNLRRSVGFSLKQDLKNHALILGATRCKLRPMESSMAWVWWQPPRPAAELEMKKHCENTSNIFCITCLGLMAWPVFWFLGFRFVDWKNDLLSGNGPKKLLEGWQAGTSTGYSIPNTTTMDRCLTSPAQVCQLGQHQLSDWLWLCCSLFLLAFLGEKVVSKELAL